jgi:hypothetical protein
MEEKMFKIRIIYLFMPIFFASLIFAGSPAGAQETSEFTYVSVNNGQFEASIDGGVLRDPCYYDPNVGLCVQMARAAEAWFCETGPPPEGYPTAWLYENCRRFNYGNICFATGSGVVTGGSNLWLSCPCSSCPWLSSCQ